MTKPTPAKVKKHFKLTKEVRCLKNNIIIDVNGISEFQFNEQDNSYSSIGGAVVFWKDGVFATIVTARKCNNCTNCSCKDNKPKTIKRNSKKTT